VIFNQGDPGSCMYIVQSGLIEMVIGDKVVEISGPNEVPGVFGGSTASWPYVPCAAR
jgi:CRP-like cAMP-binding protein